MKKISLMVMALMVAMTMSATVVSFDFSNPTSLGLTPSSKSGAGVALNDETITVGVVAMSFNVPSGNGAKLWTASGPAYTLRLYMPSQMIFTSSGDNIRGIRVTRSQGDITELDDKSEWRGNATSVTLSVPDKGKANYITVVTVYVGEEMPAQKADTISVTEARQRIDAKNLGSCYIKAVVASAPFVLNSRNCIWFTDINNPGDSIEGFGIRKGKASKETYPSLDSMAVDFGLQDTVLVYADALGKFNSIYELAGGYYVSTISKSSAINANSIFKYAVGALQWGKASDSVRYKYELILSKEDEEDVENALHMIINSANEKGIAGKYSIRNYQGDSSYVDGYGPVAGSVTIAYVAQSGDYNNYSVKGDFTVGATLYRMDTTYAISGWDKDLSDQFALVDDRPFIPQEGDTITCAQAASYAKSLGTGTGVNVYVRGFAVGFQTIDGRSQQSPYMADDATATKGVFQAYRCYTQNLDSIIKGDEIIAYGPVSYYAQNDKCQIQKGQIYRVGGSDTKRPRVVQYERCPESAITVDQAITIGQALTGEQDTTVYTEESYLIRGTITEVILQTENGTATYMLSNKEGSILEVNHCSMPSLICSGDYICVQGYISKTMSNNDPTSYISVSNGIGLFISPYGNIFSITKIAIHGSIIGDNNAYSDSLVTLSASADYGYHFTQWSDGVTDNPRSFVITQDTTFEAQFAKNMYSVSTSVNDVNRGYTEGDTSSLYLTKIEISATPFYGYHFTQWSDGNVNNPRQIQVTGNKTFTAQFDKNTYTVTTSKDANTASVTAGGIYNYLDEVELTVVANVNWQFDHWSDGNTDNPRTLIVTQDTSITAFCSRIRSGKCGDNLTWNYADGILVVSGTGAMYDYTQGTAPWMALYKDSITSIVINNGCTSIGNFAFYGLQNRAFTQLAFPQTVKTIGAYAFANCNRLTSISLPASLLDIANFAFSGCVSVNDITSVATTRPDIYENTFKDVSSYAYLYVPCDHLRSYQLNAFWSRFDLKCIGAEETTVTNDTVIVNPQENDAAFTWPTNSQAASYSLQITKDGVVFCTLTFNSLGQLIGLAFAPGRGSAMEATEQATIQSGNGFTFTVKGLNSASAYAFNMEVKDSGNQTIKSYNGTFQTKGIPTNLDQLTTSPAHRFTKILKDGQLLILRDGKTYNAQGGEL